MSSKKTIYLIDGSSYIYRAFYALGRLSSSRGMPTQAVYGFAQMLQKVIREQEPDLICVVFDARGPSFRQEIYDAYKATRQKMPEDLALQVPYIKKLVRHQGIPQIEVEGYEADDLIATLADWAVSRELDVVIVSGDKDLHQLIEDPRVRQWDPQKDKVFTEEEVEKRFGVKPGQMRDLLALMGDSSDNVPGVKGVGEKTARQLLQTWGSLENIYEHLDEISSAAVRKKLEQSRDLAFMSRSLVSFKKDLPVEREPGRFERREPEVPELVSLYEELEFKGLLESLTQELGESGQTVVSGPTRRRRTDHIVRTGEELSQLVSLLEKQERFCIDIESTSRDPMVAKLVGVALSWKDGEAFYVPVGHNGPNSERQLSQKEVIEALRPFLESRQHGKVGQNAKYEWVLLKRHGVQLRGIAYDTMVASYLLDPGRHSHSLDRIAAEHLGEKMISYTDVTGKGKGQIGFSEVDVLQAADYACEDAETTWRLVPVLKRKLEEADLEDLYEYLELPLVDILAGMEYHGILADADRLESLSRDLQAALDQKAALIYELAKEEFNIQSPKQLACILFDKLGLRVVKQTKSGPSTDVRVLEELAADHPIVEQVLSYRTLAKLKGTYADSLPKLIHPETGRIHTSYNQTVTATGRLSSSDPNLQNIPIRTEEGKRIREAFVAPPGHVLFSADYSQIELRILAHYSQDRHLLEAFREGADIHRRTAAEMYGVPPHEVTLEMRRQAKTINFGIIYGMGAFGLAQRLRISNKMARAAIERYFERYQGVKRLIDSSVRSAAERGWSETLLGRKRTIPELHSRNRTIRQQGERLAVNTPIQGTAADLIKKAMIDVDQALRKKGLKTVMLLQVHDELVFEVPVEELEDVRELVRHEMENVWELDVPLRIETGWGENWTAAHP